MMIISFLSALTSLGPFICNVYDRLYKSDASPAKAEMPDDVTEKYEKAKASFDDLVEKSSILAGSAVLGSIIDPPDADERADAVFREFTDAYRVFVADLRSFLAAASAKKDQAASSMSWKDVESVKTALEQKEINWEDVSRQVGDLYNGAVNNEKRYNSRLLNNLASFAVSEASSQTSDFAGVLSDVMTAAAKSGAVEKVCEAAAEKVNSFGRKAENIADAEFTVKKI